MAKPAMKTTSRPLPSDREPTRVQDPVQPPPAAKSDTDLSKSKDVVMVACKVPAGIWLELISPSPNPLQPAPTGPRIFVKGGASMREDRRAAQGEYPYAVTPVPRAMWEEWLKRNAELEFVRKGFIFAAPSLEHARAQGKEQQGERTGLEALATEKDPRVKQIGRMGGSEVEGDQESLARAQAAPL